MCHVSRSKYNVILIISCKAKPTEHCIKEFACKVCVQANFIKIAKFVDNFSKNLLQERTPISGFIHCVIKNCNRQTIHDLFPFSIRELSLVQEVFNFPKHNIAIGVFIFCGRFHILWFQWTHFSRHTKVSHNTCCHKINARLCTKACFFILEKTLVDFCKGIVNLILSLVMNPLQIF